MNKVHPPNGPIPLVNPILRTSLFCKIWDWHSTLSPVFYETCRTGRPPTLNQACKTLPRPKKNVYIYISICFYIFIYIVLYIYINIQKECDTEIPKPSVHQTAIVRCQTTGNSPSAPMIPKPALIASEQSTCTKQSPASQEQVLFHLYIYITKYQYYIYKITHII